MEPPPPPRGRWRLSRTFRSILPRSETLAVVGESGSGKSTVARIIDGPAAALERRGRARGQELVAPALAQRLARHFAPHADGASDARRTALNPRQTLAQIIGRPVARFFFKKNAADRCAPECWNCLGLVGLPARFRGAPAGAIVGRAKTARLHRAGAGGRPRNHHLRRAHLRARPAGGRGGAQTAQASAGPNSASPISSSPTISARCAASPIARR